MGARRDPNIKKHSAPRLRWFALRFVDMANQYREHAKNFDEKAARYIQRAEKLEKET